MASLRLGGGPGGVAVPGGTAAGEPAASVGRAPGSADRRRPSAVPARPGPQPSRAQSSLGVALTALGLLVDVAAARWMIDGWPVEGLLLHVPAALTWALGVAALDGWSPSVAGWLARPAWIGPGATRSADAGRLVERRPIPGRVLAAALLVLVLPPGIGSAGFSLAFVACRWVPGHRQSEPTPAEAGPARPAPSRAPIDRLRELAIEPLVDVLRGSDVELKRTAIEVLGGKRAASSVRLLRGLLIDQHPDVRSAAGVMLFRLENDFTGEVRRAEVRATERSDLAERHMAYAIACYRYAGSGLLGESAARFYLGRAADALRLAQENDPSQPELWHWLARVRADLDDAEAALAAVDKALALPDADPDLYLLGAEVAFRHDEVASIVGLARRGLNRWPEAHPTRRALAWWADLPSPPVEVGG